mgnify:CR=1 FL=1
MEERNGFQEGEDFFWKKKSLKFITREWFGIPLKQGGILPLVLNLNGDDRLSGFC